MIYLEFLRLYFAPETNNLSVILKKIPIKTFERILDLKKFIKEDKPSKNKKKDKIQNNSLNNLGEAKKIDKGKEDLLSAPSGLLQFCDIQSKHSKFSFKNLSFFKNSLKAMPESGIGRLDNYLREAGNQEGTLSTAKIKLKYNDASSVIDMDNNIEVDSKF